MLHTIPTLRYDIQIVPANEQQTQFYLYDPYGYAEQTLTVSNTLLQLLMANKFEDESNTIDDIPEDLQTTFRTTLATLSESYLRSDVPK